MADTERKERFHLHNGGESAIEVVMEPWGMPLMLDPRASFEIVIYGPVDGSIEVEFCGGDRVTVYGWTGSRVVVLKNGEEVYSTIEGPPVPETPPVPQLSGAIVR
jgi:hypothetical protein